ncbi:hypothetical protein [Litorilituus sediminis]|uniref:STAS/SEC14 domain-containing protein n=1 Tax=Litorilituus sediminis TaxID=718192 RepID=A0A4P6PAC0_9GAMM|nr:hypothetical protein [Litorilituus sediminis]QBG36572.1 hypothetical protein EMK97_13020 [Litorilituus sediminis]
MKYKLSFATINLIKDNIIEVIVDAGVEISMEMAEEYEDFLAKLFDDDFAVLVNKINRYDYAFEAKLTIASHEKLKAIAVISYDDEATKKVDEMNKLRQLDGWNLKVFSGLNFGWQDGVDWLEQELLAG